MLIVFGLCCLVNFVLSCLVCCMLLRLRLRVGCFGIYLIIVCGVFGMLGLDGLIYVCSLHCWLLFAFDCVLICFVCCWCGLLLVSCLFVWCGLWLRLLGSRFIAWRLVCGLLFWNVFGFVFGV